MKKNFSKLEEKFKHFISTSLGSICLDDMKESFEKGDGRQYQMADFLLKKDKIILEMKTLFSDRSQIVNEKLNDLTKTDLWLKNNWYGEVPLEELIEKHPNSVQFRQKILDFAYRNIKENILKKANEQLGITKKILSIPKTIGGLVLLNDKVVSYDSNHLSTEILFHLKTGKFESIDFVIFISEINEGYIDLNLLLNSSTGNDEYVKWYFESNFMFKWASYNNAGIQMHR
ncbi:TPA: hypothetical protein U2J52_003328 [Providencia rettgeri]|uniref:hypothetical protein n=1 Tax=Providencia rettgeri TaxID=587 RepID=UPI000D6F2981|nr:hypothetical protein [Providencia rettgeri]MDM9284578.1 hypothetical protein [Providencia rettgeri]HEM7527089.1 hypothetical protein [Providencia rettgeri]